MPEQCPDTFQTFVEWLYTSNIELVRDERVQMLETRGGRFVRDLYNTFQLAVHSFALGDYIRAPRFCNDVLDAISQRLHDEKAVPDAGIVTSSCVMLPVGCAFRRYLADQYAIRMWPRDFAREAPGLPTDFLVEVVIAGISFLGHRFEELWPILQARCRYVN